MWIFSKYGFYSVSCARDEKGITDCDNVMIRARMREHLSQLKGRFPEIATLNIDCSNTNDYMYRMTMPKKQWVTLLSEMAMEQTWSNFKNEASTFEKLFQLSYSYVDALHEVWNVMFRVQQKENRRKLPPAQQTAPSGKKGNKWLRKQLELLHQQKAASTLPAPQEKSSV